MTNDEKLNMLKRGISPDIDTDEVLNDALASAGALILNKMYPFGYPDGAVVPARYENIQVQLAVELYSKRGAEGQTNHSENGINRSWPEKSALLAWVVPQCGSVM
jgi:hypothetical protein